MFDWHGQMWKNQLFHIQLETRDTVYVLEVGAEYMDDADELGKIYLMERYGIDPSNIRNSNHNQIGYTNEEGIINDSQSNRPS